MVVLEATFTLGEEEPVTVEVTVTIAKEAEAGELVLAYEFDFESPHSNQYNDATPEYTNKVDNSKVVFNLHRVSANTTGKVPGATNALIFSGRTDNSDGKAWAVVTLGTEPIKKLEFDCYYWNDAAKNLVDKFELQVKVDGEWVTVLDLLDEIDGPLGIYQVVVEDLNATEFRFYSEGHASNNKARVILDNLKAYK